MSSPTDPRQLPGADPHTGNRKVDPVTGHDTTGHDWGGITELNTAFPKIVIWALVLTFLYSVVAWISCRPGRPDATTHAGCLGWIRAKRRSRGLAIFLTGGRIGCRGFRMTASIACAPMRP